MLAIDSHQVLRSTSSRAWTAICSTASDACRKAAGRVAGAAGPALCRRPRNGLEHTLALALAAAVLFVVANSFPFLSFEMKGASPRRRSSAASSISTSGGK